MFVAPLARMQNSIGLLDLLPHGPDARMIARVRSIERDRVETEMDWGLDDARIAAHFPHGPHVVPGVFLAEQAAQSALLMAMAKNSVGKVFLLGQLRCDFVAPAMAPCTVLTRALISAAVRGAIGFQAECFSGEKLLARIKGVATPSPTIA